MELSRKRARDTEKETDKHKEIQRNREQDRRRKRERQKEKREKEQWGETVIDDSRLFSSMPAHGSLSTGAETPLQQVGLKRSSTGRPFSGLTPSAKSFCAQPGLVRFEISFSVRWDFRAESSCYSSVYSLRLLLLRPVVLSSKRIPRTPARWRTTRWMP